MKCCEGQGLQVSPAVAGDWPPHQHRQQVALQVMMMMMVMMLMMMMIQEEDAHSRLPLQDPAGLPRRDEQALWQALWRHSGAASKQGKGEYSSAKNDYWNLKNSLVLSRKILKLLAKLTFQNLFSTQKTYFSYNVLKNIYLHKVENFDQYHTNWPITGWGVWPVSY